MSFAKGARRRSQLLPASMQSSNPTAAAQMARMTEATQAFASTTRTSVMNAADGTGLSSRYHRSRRVVSIPIQRTRAVGDPARSHKERLGNGSQASSAEGSPLRSSATRTTGLPAVISKRVALQAHSRDSAMSTRSILPSSEERAQRERFHRAVRADGAHQTESKAEAVLPFALTRSLPEHDSHVALPTAPSNLSSPSSSNSLFSRGRPPARCFVR